jgi:DNA-binding NtrC family response regulator
MKPRFLLISGEEGHRWYQIFKEAAAPIGSVHFVKEEEAIPAILKQEYDLVIVDATVVMDVPTLISRIRRKRPDAHVVTAAATPTWTRARDAFHAGALDCIRKSSDKDEILFDLEDALARAQSIDRAAESFEEEPK